MNHEESQQSFEHDLPTFPTNSRQSKFSVQQNSIIALELTHRIVRQQISLKISIIFSILAQKMLNKQMQAFSLLKKYQGSKIGPYACLQFQGQNIGLIAQKIEMFAYKCQFKLIYQGWLVLTIKNHHQRIIESPQARQQLRRISSKNSQTKKLADSNKSRLTNDNEISKRQNAYLKKKKEKLQINLTNFYSKMDKLLTSHQMILKK